MQATNPVVPPTLESGMNTGQGADDEPEMTIGEKFDEAEETDDETLVEAEIALGATPTERRQKTANQAEEP